jgi:hypothetical protein
MMMIKQEQGMEYHGFNTNNMMLPMQPLDSDAYYSTESDMCHPLIMDDYDGSISSLDVTNGPLLSPSSPTDNLSSPSSTSSAMPPTDDQWYDLYSPSATFQYPSPHSYFVDQRHSFDHSMLLANNAPKPCLDNTPMDSTCCPYPCNSDNYTNGMIDYPAPSFNSYCQQPQMVTARHQSMPMLYHQGRLHPSHTRPIVSIATTTASDIRPYQCQICDRSFARKHDLQRHIRVHTGDKPYACLCCNKAFARTDALKRHLRMEEVCRNSPQIQALKSSGKRRYKNL